MYIQGSAKRQKTASKDAARSAESFENFQGVSRIEYKPEVLPNTEDILFYRYYNRNERIHGRPMEDWLRPCIFIRTSSIQSKGVDNYKKRIQGLFELCMKLGVKFWAGYDVDIAPVGATIEETQNIMEQLVSSIHEYQLKTGIKPLWIGVDFNYNAEYKYGAATSSESLLVMHASYKVKKALDIANKLGAEHFLVSAAQEGYTHLLNTDTIKELTHFSKFLKLIIQQCDKIGYQGKLLIDTFSYDCSANKEHKYCSDAFSALCFLKHFNLDRFYKLNVPCGHEFHMMNMYGSVGCVMIKDKHLTDVYMATLLFHALIQKGSLLPGGIIMYLSNHDSTFESRDLAEAFAAGLDCYSKALRLAVKFINDSYLNKNIQMRYSSFSSEWGAKFSISETSLEECEEYLKKSPESQLSRSYSSARFEHWNSVLSRFIDL